MGRVSPVPCTVLFELLFQENHGNKNERNIIKDYRSLEGSLDKYSTFKKGLQDSATGVAHAFNFSTREAEAGGSL